METTSTVQSGGSDGGAMPFHAAEIRGEGQVLMVLDTGHLVPIDFVTEVADGRITVEVPEGLWEL